MVRLLLLWTSYRQTRVVLLVDDVHIYTTSVSSLAGSRINTVIVALDSGCGYACCLECLDDTSSTLGSESIVEGYRTIDTSIAVYEDEGAWIADDKVSDVTYGLETLCVENVRIDLKEDATTELYVVT